MRHDINDRISLYTGSVTTLALDAVVNAANNELKPGGGGGESSQYLYGSVYYEVGFSL